MKSILTRNNTKKTAQQGITLIALVVTIIVLLILAGVSIMMLTGQNGILRRAEESSTRTAHSEVYEMLNLETAEYLTESKLGNYSGTLIDYLKDEKYYIKIMEGIDGYIIDVEKLLGAKGKYGNGTDGKTDVYKLEEVTTGASITKVATIRVAEIEDKKTGKKYEVIYYGTTEKEKVSLGYLQDEEMNEINDQDRLEDDFALCGHYNDSTGKVEDIYIEFFHDFYNENEIIEEALILTSAIEGNITNATTWDDFVEEKYKEGWVTKKYYTAKEFFSEYMINTQYNEEINELREIYPDEELTDEELFLKYQREQNESEAETWDKFMQELIDEGLVDKKFNNCKELFAYEIDVDELYNQVIQESKEKNNFDSRDIYIEDESGEIRSYIQKEGTYKFFIKVNEMKLREFKIIINRYEVIQCFGELYNKEEDFVSGVVAYDFAEKKILNIDSGEYDCFNELDGEEKQTVEILDEQIKTLENVGNYVEIDYDLDKIYDFRLKSDNIVITGYSYARK